MTEIPDPTEYARQIAPDPVEDGEGVAWDTLTDAMVDADHAQYELNQMAVVLDGICDDRGLLPGQLRADLRDHQRDLRGAAAWVEEFQAALAAERESL